MVNISIVITPVLILFHFLSILGIPGVPINPRSLHQTYNSITFQWDNVDGATSYQVVYKALGGPDITMLAFPKLPEITVHKLKDNQMYMFKVRAKNELGYGEYTKPLAVKTGQIGMNIGIFIKNVFVNITLDNTEHCVRSVRIRSYSGPHFPSFGLTTRNTPYLSIFSPNAGKCGPE